MTIASFIFTGAEHKVSQAEPHCSLMWAAADENVNGWGNLLFSCIKKNTLFLFILLGIYFFKINKFEPFWRCFIYTEDWLGVTRVEPRRSPCDLTAEAGENGPWKEIHFILPVSYQIWFFFFLIHLFTYILRMLYNTTMYYTVDWAISGLVFPKRTALPPQGAGQPTACLPRYNDYLKIFKCNFAQNRSGIESDDDAAFPLE